MLTFGTRPVIFFPPYTPYLTPTSHSRTPSLLLFLPAFSLTQTVRWCPYVTWQARLSKWWLYLNVDEREMRTATVFVNGVLFGRGGWGVRSYLADVKQRRRAGERETGSQDDLTTLSVEASRWALRMWPFTSSLCDTWQWSPFSSCVLDSPETSLILMPKIRRKIGIC